MRKKAFWASVIVIFGVLAGIAILSPSGLLNSYLFPRSYVRPGLTLSYNETVGLKSSPTHVAFNVSVIKVKGQVIYFNYTITQALNVTFKSPSTSRNFTVFFNPYENSTYVCIQYFGLPIFASGLHNGTGASLVRLEGLTFRNSYSVEGNRVTINLTSFERELGKPLISIYFSGNYDRYGILTGCNVTSASAGITIYESVKLVSVNVR
ncbi:MAG: hypothetical protein ACP5UU_02250 [Thermoprotei archaeon]